MINDYLNCAHCGSRPDYKPRDVVFCSNSYCALSDSSFTKEEWNTRAYTPALSTLQTLLNQAAEAGALIKDILPFVDLDDEALINAEEWGCDVSGKVLKFRQALAAIQPYLTKDGE